MCLLPHFQLAQNLQEESKADNSISAKAESHKEQARAAK